MNVQFKLRDNKAKGLTSIRLIVYLKGERLVYSIGESVDPSLWDRDKQRVIIPRGKKEIQDRCRDINIIIDRTQDILIKLESELVRSDIPVNADTIKEELEKRLSSKKRSNTAFIVPFLESFIEDLEKGERTTDRGKYSEGTIRAYKCTLLHLKEYESKHRMKIRFDKLTSDLYSKYLSCHSKTYKPNTLGKDFKNIKVISKIAKRSGISVNDQIEDYKTISVDVDVIYLNVDELRKIEEVDLSQKPMLDNARDLFLLTCWTGLRYSDIEKLREQHFTDNGKRIRLSMKKTSGNVVIPVFPTVQRIRDKHKGLPRIISNVKLNEYIKDVCKEAGIDQLIPVKEYKNGMTYEVNKPKYSLVTVHTGRRSFATNLYKTGEVTVRDIMSVTGHKSESAFYKYIRITPDESADRLDAIDFSASLKVAR